MERGESWDTYGEFMLNSVTWRSKAQALRNATEAPWMQKAFLAVPSGGRHWHIPKLLYDALLQLLLLSMQGHRLWP